MPTYDAGLAVATTVACPHPITARGWAKTPEMTRYYPCCAMCAFVWLWPKQGPR